MHSEAHRNLVVARRPRTNGLSAARASTQLQLTSTILGTGSFSTVHLGTLHGIPVAAKRSLQANADSKIHLRTEARHHRHLRHPCIIQFFDILELPSSQPPNHDLVLVTEYMRGGSLFHALGELRDEGVDAMALESLLRVARQAAHALSYLHSQNISYGDMKSMNILLSEKVHIQDASFANGTQAKLCDFGLSINHNQPHEAHSSSDRRAPQGTYAYLAPEAFSGLQTHDESAAKAADVYALGVVLWELATLQKPWAQKKPLQLIHLVAKEGLRPSWPSALNVPCAYVKLVERCWQHDALRRPTMHEICDELDHMYARLSTDGMTGYSTDCAGCNLDDLADLEAIDVHDESDEEQSETDERSDERVDWSSGLIKPVQSVRLSAEEVLHMCDSWSEVASEVTHASVARRQYDVPMDALDEAAMERELRLLEERDSACGLEVLGIPLRRRGAFV